MPSLSTAVKYFIFLFVVALHVTAASAELKIVTTLPVHATITKEIAGDTATVTSILHVGADPHEFEPRPNDVIQLQHCDFFIHTGLDMEPWKETLITATGRNDLGDVSPKKLDLSKTVSLILSPRVASDAVSIEHTLGNPHYWMAAENGRRIAKAIADRLIAISPEHTALYSKNLSDFEQSLDKTESVLASQAKKLTDITMIAQHDEWQYLTDTLGMHIGMYLEAQPGKQPAPSQIKKVRDLLSGKTISLITLDTDPGQYRLAEGLSAEYSVPLIRLSQQPNVGESYEAFLERDVSLIVSTLNK